MKEDPRPSAPRAGFIANRVHAGDPHQAVSVAGFSEWAAAASFAAGAAQPAKPLFQQKLAPGESVQFSQAALPGQAAVLVLYSEDEHGQRTPLLLSRAHADLPLAIGSCGYQLFLAIDLGSFAQSPEPGLNR